jgi:hypothetical protein
MRLRRLNEKGIEEFGVFLDQLSADSTLPQPKHLLEDPDKSVKVTVNVEVPLQLFRDRFEAAKCLYEVFIRAGISDSELDPGVWAWLALYWFDALKPPSGKKAQGWPGERARWIPSPSHDWKKFYRHLLRGPWLVYRFHSDDPDRARVVLCGQLYAPGEVSEQLLSRQELITNRGFIELATRLYYDPLTGKVKRGTADKKPGDIRRYSKAFPDQFGITWDLYAMKAEDIAALLPKEFGRFLS